MSLSNGVTKGKAFGSTAKNERVKYCFSVLNSMPIPSVRNKDQS